MKGKAMKSNKPQHGWCIRCEQYQQTVTPDRTLKTRLLLPQGICEWCGIEDRTCRYCGYRFETAADREAHIPCPEKTGDNPQREEEQNDRATQDSIIPDGASGIASVRLS
jgi:hypothetical protein